MTTPKAGGWIAGTVVVSLILAIAGWFLAISPTLATASETRVAAQAQRDDNAIRTIKIEKLKQQFAEIEQLKASLAAMQLQIPTSYDVAAYSRQLATIAGAHEVTITSLQTGVASPMFSTAAAAPVEAETTESTTAVDDETAVDSTATTATTGIPAFYFMPTSMNVVGTYQNVLAFLQDIQTATDRLFLVESLSGASLDQSEASGGRPATSPGDLELVINGSLYVLADSSGATVVVEDPAAVAPVLPVPDAGKNPMQPLG